MDLRQVGHGPQPGEGEEGAGQPGVGEKAGPGGAVLHHRQQAGQPGRAIDLAGRGVEHPGAGGEGHQQREHADHDEHRAPTRHLGGPGQRRAGEDRAEVADQHAQTGDRGKAALVETQRDQLEHGNEGDADAEADQGAADEGQFESSAPGRTRWPRRRPPARPRTGCGADPGCPRARRWESASPYRRRSRSRPGCRAGHRRWRRRIAGRPKSPPAPRDGRRTAGRPPIGHAEAEQHALARGRHFQTSGLTRLGGRWPESAAIRLFAAVIAMAMRVARELEPICGVSVTLSSSRKPGFSLPARPRTHRARRPRVGAGATPKSAPHRRRCRRGRR
jgi:hypothetical protein